MISGLKSYMSEMWEYRYFWTQLVRSDLQKRYRRSILGLGWSLLQPLAMTAVLSLVYSRVLKMDFGSFAPMLLTGLAFWGLIQSSSVQGCGCFIAAEPFIRQQPLPTVIFSLRIVLTSGFHFLIALTLAVLMAGTNLGGVSPALITLIPSLLLLFVFAWSLATILAYCHVYFPDTQHLAEVALQVFMYLTPIVYPPSLLEQNGLWFLLEFNPLALILQLIRDPILAGHCPTLWAYAKVGIFVIPLGALAIMTVAKLERRLIFAM
ncbi:MAG: ABC transporter permease [Planctomycetia bacterium]|nr:ABC transporter permease [Planctomycetia bacterium]